MKLSKGVEAIAVFQGMLMAMLLALIMSPVHASELVAANTEQPLALLDLLAVFLGSEKAAQWLSVLGLVGFIFTQLRAWLPAHWLAKLPRWLVNLLEVLAGNYRRAKNETISTPRATVKRSKPI